MAGTNFVGNVTIAAGATVNLFTAANGGTAVPGVFSFSGVNNEGGLYQVNSATPSAGDPSWPLTNVASLNTGTAPFYVENQGTASVTLLVRFSTTA